jgi:hypothetical protein
VTLWKNAKVKQRNSFSTCCELCSPSLLILVLVWGFSLSTITSIPAQNYAVVKANIPNQITGLMSGTGFGSVLDLLE